VEAIERAIGFVEATARRHGIENAMQAGIGLSDGHRLLVVCEPLSDLAGVWDEIPEASVLIVQPGADVLRPFRPHDELSGTNGTLALDAARA
jgi:glutamine amidotransferase